MEPPKAYVHQVSVPLTTERTPFLDIGTVTRNIDRDLDYIPGDDYSDLSVVEIKIEGKA